VNAMDKETQQMVRQWTYCSWKALLEKRGGYKKGAHAFSLLFPPEDDTMPPKRIKQWADWSLWRISTGEYEIVREDSGLFERFAATDDQAAEKESCRIARRLEKRP